MCPKEQSMKILFSPSETKHKGGISKGITKNNYLFPELFDIRLEMIQLYRNYILEASNETLEKLFGTKKESVIKYYTNDIFEQKTMKVIERYDGVAYDYLKYQTLEKNQKRYIDQNVIIFSNLFGPLLAGDKGLPDYKLKQGVKIGDIAPEKFYKEHFTDSLNKELTNEHYLDLRAGFYHKFYKPTSAYTTLKFIKDGKVVSHWAKAYRGIVLRYLATHNIQNIDDFNKINIPNLLLKETIQKDFHREIIYEIVS